MKLAIHNVEIRESGIHNKGVFALKTLPKNSELVCDVLVFPKGSAMCLDIYHYPWSPYESCICAGFGSFLNHSDEPNLRVVAIDRLKKTKTFMTMRRIRPGEELLICYGNNVTFKKS